MVNSKLKASFVIPTRNNVTTIEQCLSSLTQYGDYIKDIVVVDGSSTDGTAEVISKFPVKILADPGKGQNLAQELGWRESEGDLVIFMDADAYLGEGFFPAMLDLFKDDRLGLVGCPGRFVGTGKLWKTVAQWNEYNNRVRTQPKGVIEKIHRAVIFQNSQGESLPLGPCQAVRRKALESVDGFRGVSLKLPCDAITAYQVASGGWKWHIWTDAPLNHYARSTTNELVDEYYRFGRETAYFWGNREINPANPLLRRVSFSLACLASPLLGMLMALRFRNPRHLVYFPLTRFVALGGFFKALFTKRTEQTIS